MTTTFSALVTRIQTTINDSGAATWSTAEIASFLNDAIRDYSNHFPRIMTDSITLTNGTQEYDLNTDYMGVLSVEYPDGESPREFLKRRPYTQGNGADFFGLDGYYDILKRDDDDDNEAQIVFSEDLVTDETAVVEYTAHHALIANTASISGDCTVIPQHQHLLVKFCAWQATLYLKSAEEQAPTSNSSLLMAQLAQNARRLALDYSTALQQAIYSADGESRSINWITPESGMERIY